MKTMTTHALISFVALASACELQTASPESRSLALAQEADIDLLEEGAVDAFRAVPIEVILPDVVDRDGDGFAAAADPDDDDPRAFPGAPEVPCDGLDQDGDLIDDCPPDLDGDGVRANLDCDDGDPGVQPFAVEIRCNGLDENCDGVDQCPDDDEVVDRPPPQSWTGHGD